MPICLKCGGYYVREPCPFCNPPTHESAAKQASSSAVGTSVEELLQTLETVEAEINQVIEDSNERRIGLELKLKNKKDSLEPKRQELAGINAQLNQLQERYGEISAEIQEIGVVKLEENKKSLLDQITEKEKNINELQNAKPDELPAIDGIEASLKKLREEMDKVTEERKKNQNELQQQISELENTKKEKENLIKMKDEEIMSLEADLQKLSIKDLSSKVNELETEIKKLNEQLSAKNEKKTELESQI
ncbi:MAG: hypothetical protein ACFFC7_15930 [Candidatus Hermodarchaeota archaeon]